MMNNKRSHGSMSSTSGSSKSATSTSLVDISDLAMLLVFIGPPSLDMAGQVSGQIEVNDTNSPGGRRSTQIYAREGMDPSGKRVIFETWGGDSHKTGKYMRLEILLITYYPKRYVTLILKI